MEYLKEKRKNEETKMKYRNIMAESLHKENNWEDVA
jgi:hypothetical protein